LTEHVLGQTLYDVLGVETNAPAGKIQAIFRLRTQQTHPDRKNGNGDLQKLLNEAYAVLKDPEKRREYNEEMGLPLNPRPLKPGKTVYGEISLGRQEANRPTLYSFIRWEPCSRCWGEGCSRCQHKGKIHQTVTLTVTVPAKVSQHLVEDQGKIAEPGGRRGDLVLYVIWR
jgi:DnaJ-class molecular chaperone